MGERWRKLHLYSQKQKEFDRFLWQCKREYNHGLMEHVEMVTTENPFEFWKYFKNVGKEE